MHARQFTTRGLVAATLATAVAAGGAVGTQPAQAAPQEYAAAPTAMTATSTARTPGRTSIDMDGDGRADRTTLTKVRSTRDAHIFRLVTRTATGRTISTLVSAPNNLDDTGVDDIYVGAAGVDGVRGGEIILDLMGGVGDATHHVVYTVRQGKFTTLRAPGAKSDRTPWNVQYFPGVEAGYEFSTSGGVRRVTATVFTSVRTDANHKVISSSGFRTSYRWGSHGWMKSGTVRLKDVPPKKAASYAGWHGLTWR